MTFEKHHFSRGVAHHSALPGRIITADILRQIYYGRYITADLYNGKYIAADILRQIYYGKCVTADILQQMDYCKCVRADILWNYTTELPKRNPRTPETSLEPLGFPGTSWADP